MAVLGGTPVRSIPLPWEFPGASFIDEKELQLITQTVKNQSPFRFYGKNVQHMVDKLEESFRTKFSIPYALGVNSGTAALHIALAALGVGPGDEVLIPGYLWVSCVCAIIVTFGCYTPFS